MSVGDARLGLRAAGLWTLGEFVIRHGLLVIGGSGLVLLSGGVPSDSALGPFAGMAVAVPIGLAAVALTAIFRRRAVREGLGLRDLGYQLGRRSILAGAVSGLLLLLVAWGTSHVDVALFPDAAKSFDRLMRVMARSGPTVLAMVLLANGILAPLAEEFAWRGYIQYRLTRAWGAWAGLVATAMLFATKHIVVDVSFGRVTTLLVGACLLGLVRQQWGTAASTAAHITVNFLATIDVFATALTS